MIDGEDQAQVSASRRLDFESFNSLHAVLCVSMLSMSQESDGEKLSRKLLKAGSRYMDVLLSV